MKLPAITRPNGSTYRPRSLTSRTLGDEDETTGIVVFGTHDLSEAASIARLDVRALNREIGFHADDEQYAVQEDTARRIWWRQELSHFDENEARYWYQEDPEKGRAGVHFDIELVEPPADAQPSFPDPEPMFDVHVTSHADGSRG